MMSGGYIHKLKKKLWLRNYKRTLKCAHCPESFWACLEFHHRDGANKDGKITKMVRDSASLKAIQAEIAKCTVLCSNCHRKLHAALNEAVDPEARWIRLIEEWEARERKPKGRPRAHCQEMTAALQVKYQDPEWRAEQGRKISEGRRKKVTTSLPI